MTNTDTGKAGSAPPRDAAAWSADALVVQQFEAAARRAPDAIAVTCLPRGDGGLELHVSYGRLNAMANRVARRLRAAGVGPESVVGVAVDHDLATIVSLLGAVKAGACFLPLDGSLPDLRLRRIVEESGCRAILVNRERAPRYAALPIERVVVDDEQAPDPAAAKGGAGTVLDARNAVYVIYTSGSTGEPKGVVVTHGGLANHNRGFADIVGLAPGDAVLQFASLAFDAAYEEIFPTLCRGARLVLRNPEMAQDAGELVRRCAEQQVTVIDVPTAFWRALTGMLGPDGLRIPDAVRWVVIGGEEAQAADVARWKEHAPETLHLLNTYGPTEATIIVTARELLHQPLAEDEGVPLGSALPGTAVRLRDGARACEPGEVGEIHVSGAGVARGYLNAPRLTAERFLPDPASAEGGRAYRTGDLAAVSPSGELIFKGRRDHQVKLRGHRIQLEEVEGALLSHPSIKACAVVLADDLVGGKHLIAYCVLHGGQQVLPFETRPLGTDGLKAYLRERLPEPMIPADFSFLEKFILTPGGKIDRARLPKLGRLDRKRRGFPDYERPKPGLEARLARIWCDVLDLQADEVSAEDPFEYLGGNSLYSIQVRYKAREAGLLFKAGDLHLRQTIRGLARCCQTADGVLTRGRHALLDRSSYVWGLGQVVLRQLAGGAAARRRRGREERVRAAVQRFHDGLPSRENVFYLFFTTHLLHWLAKTESFVPRDCNLVLIGSGLQPEEAAWVRDRIHRPFLHLDEEVDLDLIWDVLFDVNRRNFGWLDVDCFVMNPTLFREMATIRADEAINTVWTHAACGPTKRPFHVLESYFLFFNAAVIDRLRAEKVLPRPSAKTATLRQIEALKRLIPADEGSREHLDRLGGGAFAHRLLNFTFARLALFQLVANARGFKLNRVRFLTEIDTFNAYNYYSDEAIHVFPSIRGYEHRNWAGSDQKLRLASDYLLMTSMLDELPPMYRARKRFLDGKLHHLPFPIDQAPAQIREYLSARGVTERTFGLQAFDWLVGDPPAAEPAPGPRMAMAAAT